MMEEPEPILDVLVTRGLSEFPEALGCCLILGPTTLHIPADSVRVGDTLTEILYQGRVVGTMPKDSPWRFLTRELFRALDQPTYHRWRARCDKETEEAMKTEVAPQETATPAVPGAPVKAPGNYL
jgi:hypothetical protein